MTAKRQEVGGRRTGQKGKRTHGHGQQCGDCGGEEGIMGINANEKKMQEKNLKKRHHVKGTDPLTRSSLGLMCLCDSWLYGLA